jgi:hypothetical protein
MGELVKAHDKLQRRLDAMYEDKLDGEVVGVLRPQAAGMAF